MSNENRRVKFIISEGVVIVKDNDLIKMLLWLINMGRYQEQVKKIELLREDTKNG